MARVEVVMPQMGESIAEGTVTKWYKKVGEKVERDEPPHRQVVDDGNFLEQLRPERDRHVERDVDDAGPGRCARPPAHPSRSPRRCRAA